MSLSLSAVLPLVVEALVLGYAWLDVVRFVPVGALVLVPVLVDHLVALAEAHVLLGAVLVAQVAVPEDVLVGAMELVQEPVEMVVLQLVH